MAEVSTRLANETLLARHPQTAEADITSSTVRVRIYWLCLFFPELTNQRKPPLSVSSLMAVVNSRPQLPSLACPYLQSDRL